MKTKNIIKNPPIQGVYFNHQKVKFLPPSNRYQPKPQKEMSLMINKARHLNFPPDKQESISPDIVNAFTVIIRTILIEQAGNISYYNAENTAVRIMELIKLMTNSNKIYIERLRAAVVNGLIDADKTLGSKSPNASYKTLELILHKVDKVLTEQ